MNNTFYSLNLSLLAGKKKRSIEVVPSIWVEFDKKAASCKVKYMDKPYTDQVCAKLQILIKNRVIPTADWPTFTVYIRGKAKIYNEAMEKLERLHQELYVFTDPDDTNYNKVAVEKALKKRKLGQ